MSNKKIENPHADLFTLCQHVEHLQPEILRSELPSNWSEIGSCGRGSNPLMHARHYYNEETHEVVICFRGTDVVRLNDLWNDLHIFIAKDLRRAFKENGKRIFPPGGKMAIDYAESINQWAQHLGGERGPPKIICTGHSLGGAYASLAATVLSTQKGGENVKFVSFDAPGVGQFLDVSVRARNDNIKKLSERSCNYYFAKNAINSAGIQLGVQKRLTMPSKLEKNIKLRHGFIKFTDSIQGDVIRFLLRWSLILVTAIPRLIAEGGVTFETHHRAHFATALGGEYIDKRKGLQKQIKRGKRVMGAVVKLRHLKPALRKGHHDSVKNMSLTRKK